MENTPGLEGEAEISDLLLPIDPASILRLLHIPPKGFDGEYLQLLGTLAWLKSTRGKTDGGRYALETVTVVRGKWCKEDLSIPRLQQDAIALHEINV